MKSALAIALAAIAIAIVLSASFLAEMLPGLSVPYLEGPLAAVLVIGASIGLLSALVALLVAFLDEGGATWVTMSITGALFASITFMYAISA